MVTKKKSAPIHKVRTNRPAPTATKPLIAERAKPRPYPYDEKVNTIGTIALVIILIVCGGAAYWLY